MKKKLKILGILFIVLIAFRGSIYRLIISYDDIGNRQNVQLTNEKLISKINHNISNINIDLNTIVEVANQITNEELSFTMSESSNNPNEIFDEKKANCVGYSSLFNSITTYIIFKNNLQDEIVAEHKIGEIYLFGVNLHQFFESQFFKDHDFNEIRNQKSGEQIFIDPSLSDNFRINRINVKD